MTRSEMFSAARLDLEYPLSLEVYDQYAKAQQVVDYPADQDFPVQNVEIVGTELRSIERVTGRLTRSKVAAAGALSGLWIGLFVGIAFSLFSDRNQLGFLVTTPLLGAVFGLAWSQLGRRRGDPAQHPRFHLGQTRSWPPSTRCSRARPRRPGSGTPSRHARADDDLGSSFRLRNCRPDPRQE